MAQDLVTGPHDEPIFSDSGAPDIGVDPTVVAEYASLVGNRKVGTSTARGLLTGKKVWEGLEHRDTDGAKNSFIYQGSDWVLDGPAHTEYTITVTGLGDATTFSAFAFANVAGSTTDASIASIVSNTVQLQPGLYDISLIGSIAAATTGLSQLFLTYAAGGSGDIARATAYAGENVWSFGMPNLYVTTANTRLTVALRKTTGGNANFSGRLRITRKIAL